MQLASGERVYELATYDQAMPPRERRQFGQGVRRGWGEASCRTSPVNYYRGVLRL